MPLNPGSPRPLASLAASSPGPRPTVASASADQSARAARHDGLVAVGPGASDLRTRTDLLSDVEALGATLTSDRGRRWLVETDDAYRVGVAFLAAVRVGARLVLPPNRQARTLEELASRSDRILVDATSPSAADPRAFDPLASQTGSSAPSRAVQASSSSCAEADRERPLVDLFTSGTSGPGKQVTKALCHLEDEVVELERALGAPLGADATVLATVPTHHLYGLLFRVLWPLAASRRFDRASVLHPDELITRVAQHGPAVVISSPAHLRHLAASSRLAEIAPQVRAIFSSGGPLATDTALALAERLGHAPREIFGSTETGGVAFRQAGAADPSPRWSTLGPVSIEISGPQGDLVIASPFVTPPEQQPETPPGADSFATSAGKAAPQPGRWRMGDRARADGDGFRLLGRSDRIAKVGEKTVSLPEIEEELARHDWVETAAVGTWRAGGGPPGADRTVQRLGAIVVPSLAGRRRLATEGRRAFASTLAAHLAQRWDRVALPRRWRFFDALPVDARGKVSAEVFATEMSRPAAAPREPVLLDERREPVADGSRDPSTKATEATPAERRERVTLEFVVPRDLAYFSGHYDTFPLVPGVVQIHWVMLSVARVLGSAGTAGTAGSAGSLGSAASAVSATSMEAVKFKSVLGPAEAFTMTLDLSQVGTGRSQLTRVRFSLCQTPGEADGLQTDGRVFSTGRITLGA